MRPPFPPDDTPRTAHLCDWIDRIQSGDESARDELLRAVADQLERLARAMLRRFPNVARWEQTGDVLSASLLRLMRALREVRPESMRAFYGLAAEQMRRELIDLARRHRNARGDSAVGPGGAASAAAAPADTEEELDRWCSFHEDVASLPAQQREVVSLAFYHGRTHEEIAELLGGVSTRTVRRHWAAALLSLRRRHGGAGPD
jgi:RNA polymerase sigma-70 factor (ECF subfamily)